MFRKILVAVDGSTGNERVLLFAEHLARVESAELVVVHAFELPSEYEWTDGFDALREATEAIAAEVVADALEVVNGEEGKAFADVRPGPPAQAILQAAHAHAVDLIIVGSRSAHHGSAAETLLGSVSARVLRESTCPVLVIP